MNKFCGGESREGGRGVQLITPDKKRRRKNRTEDRRPSDKQQHWELLYETKTSTGRELMRRIAE